MRWLAGLILKIWGWTLSGPNPADTPKYIMVAAPHTSNWDFPLGILSKFRWRIPIKWLGKSSLFKPPLGWIFRWLGGVSVDRSQRSRMTDQIAEKIQAADLFGLCIAPEGTRSYTEKIKTGFYYIAKQAGIPLILCKIDYATKTLDFSPPKDISDISLEETLAWMAETFLTARAKYPDQTIYNV